MLIKSIFSSFNQLSTIMINFLSRLTPHPRQFLLKNQQKCPQLMQNAEIRSFLQQNEKDLIQEKEEDKVICIVKHSETILEEINRIIQAEEKEVTISIFEKILQLKTNTFIHSLLSLLKRLIQYSIKERFLKLTSSSQSIFFGDICTIISEINTIKASQVQKAIALIKRVWNDRSALEVLAGFIECKGQHLLKGLITGDQQLIELSLEEVFKLHCFYGEYDSQSFKLLQRIGTVVKNYIQFSINSSPIYLLSLESSKIETAISYFRIRFHDQSQFVSEYIAYLLWKAIQLLDFELLNRILKASTLQQFVILKAKLKENEQYVKKIQQTEKQQLSFVSLLIQSQNFHVLQSLQMLKTSIYPNQSQLIEWINIVALNKYSNPSLNIDSAMIGINIAMKYEIYQKDYWKWRQLLKQLYVHPEKQASLLIEMIIDKKKQYNVWSMIAVLAILMQNIQKQHPLLKEIKQIMEKLPMPTSIQQSLILQQFQQVWNSKITHSKSQNLSHLPFVQFFTHLQNHITRQIQNKSQQILPGLLSFSSYITAQHSPLFNHQPIYFKWITNSKEDVMWIRRWMPIIGKGEWIKSIMESLPLQNRLDQIMAAIEHLIDALAEPLPINHSLAFYHRLSNAHSLTLFLSPTLLTKISTSLLSFLFDSMIPLICKPNHPILRQYLQISLGRIYLQLCQRVNKLLGLLSQNTQQSQESGLNVAVPVILVIGAEMLQSVRQGKQDQANLHMLMVRYISSHTAYIRGICQYYLLQFLSIRPSNSVFLNNIKAYLTTDRDSMKILSNISLVVDGFQSQLRSQSDFVGFQRVQEYPTNRMKLEMYAWMMKLYSRLDCQWSIKRKEQIKTKWRLEIQKGKKIGYLNEKSNFRVEKQEETAIQEKKPQIKPKEKNKIKDKSKIKNKNIVQNNATIQKNESNYLPLISSIRYLSNLNSYSQILQKSNYLPDLIILGSLLQKPPNFGHIVRSLSGLQSAMLTVPGNQILLHEDCVQLIPRGHNVQIIDIKAEELPIFIFMMKEKGYPLIALEQSSRSVTLRDAVLKDKENKAMVLLGNQRIGASSKLLQLADIVVQIPQRGKIRSLNVHVSMVLLEWQYLRTK